MRCFIFICGFFACIPVPVLAGIWGDDCEQNLSFAADISISGFNRHFVTSGIFDENYPRFLAVRYAPCANDIVMEAEKYDWSNYRDNRKPFLIELYRTRDLLNGDPGDIYALANTYQTDLSELGHSLHLLFLHWAAEREYAPAQFDVLRDLVREVSSSHNTTLNRIALIAAEGYVPAMKYLAEQFQAGEVVRKNLGRAYYWRRRIEAEDTAITQLFSEPLDQLRARFSEEDIKDLARAQRAYGNLVP